MRIAAVRTDGTNRCVVRYHVMFLKMIQDALLYFRLAHRSLTPNSVRNEAEGDVIGGAGVLGGL